MIFIQPHEASMLAVAANDERGLEIILDQLSPEGRKVALRQLALLRERKLRKRKRLGYCWLNSE